MKHRFALALLGFALFAATPAAADIYGLATVSQGDSLTVGTRRVRLYGIDTPPVTMKCSIEGKPWDCGKAARDMLIQLIDGQRLRCIEEDRDRWGRIMATCFLPSGKDVGGEMVREGMAIAFRQVSDRYVDIEDRARQAHRGIWRGNFPPTYTWSDNPKGYK